MPVRKRGERWYFDITIRGQRYRGVIPEARTKWQAKQAEARILDEIWEGKYGDGLSRVRFSDFANEVYLAWAETNKRSAKSDRLYLKSLVRFFGNMMLGAISQIDVERYKRDRLACPVWKGRPRRPASVNRELSCLSKILRLACENGYIATTPRIKMLRENNQRIRYLSADEESQLMRVLEIKHTNLRPLVILALNTGMRLGEITSLAWKQVDFQRGLIYLTNTKTGKDRAVPMNEDCRAVFDAVRGAGGAGERIFNNLPDVSSAFWKLCRQAKIEDLRFHDLRHTFATRLADAGVDGFTIAALLGHSTIQMTARYTHPTKDRLRRAVEVLTRGESLRHISVTNAETEKKRDTA
ncbi:MAG TPA: site-specific integrase [Blastocatellia bacterium]|nr:site-specific integrase [Blastocatellia bacterium]